MKNFRTLKLVGVSGPLYTALVIILAVVIAMGKLPLIMVGIIYVGRFRTSFLLPW